MRELRHNFARPFYLVILRILTILNFICEKFYRRTIKIWSNAARVFWIIIMTGGTVCISFIFGNRWWTKAKQIVRILHRGFNSPSILSRMLHLVEGQSRAVAGRQQLCFKGIISMLMLSFLASTIFLASFTAAFIKWGNPLSRKNGYLI